MREVYGWLVFAVIGMLVMLFFWLALDKIMAG